jgi:hypothetical protein
MRMAVNEALNKISPVERMVQVAGRQKGKARIAALARSQPRLKRRPILLRQAERAQKQQPSEPALSTRACQHDQHRKDTASARMQIMQSACVKSALTLHM